MAASLIRACLIHSVSRRILNACSDNIRKHKHRISFTALGILKTLTSLLLLLPDSVFSHPFCHTSRLSRSPKKHPSSCLAFPLSTLPPWHELLWDRSLGGFAYLSTKEDYECRQLILAHSSLSSLTATQLGAHAIKCKCPMPVLSLPQLGRTAYIAKQPPSSVCRRSSPRMLRKSSLATCSRPGKQLRSPHPDRRADTIQAWVRLLPVSVPSTVASAIPLCARRLTRSARPA